MSKASLVNKYIGGANLGQITISPKTSVTQVTNLGTAVTNNSPCGFITTVTTNLATQGSTSFTCSNSHVSTSKIVLANIQGYSGTVGSPSVYVKDVASGRFTVTVQNRDLINPLNGTIKIGFMVL
jgi:hypothetical protein